MFMLYNRKLILGIGIIATLVFIVEFYLPKFGFQYSGNRAYVFKLDLMLLYLAFLVFYLKNSYYVIYISFFVGIMQGLALEFDIGLLAFLKSLFSFMLTIIKKYNIIWNNYFKYLAIYLIFFLYFFLNYSLEDYFQIMELLFISSFHSISLFSLFFMFNKIFFNSKIFQLDA
tara:strand:- start:764 stop:1279 length:516 start_codon:yes stop_codon:yes gene_type:complete